MDDERKVGGRTFQTRGPETAKLRDPYVITVLLTGRMISLVRQAGRKTSVKITIHRYPETL